MNYLEDTVTVLRGGGGGNKGAADTSGFTSDGTLVNRNSSEFAKNMDKDYPMWDSVFIITLIFILIMVFCLSRIWKSQMNPNRTHYVKMGDIESMPEKRNQQPKEEEAEWVFNTGGDKDAKCIYAELLYFNSEK